MALADLMNSFRAGETPAAPQQQQQTLPGNIPPNASTGNPGSNTAAPNGVVPNGTETSTEEDKSPLDEFAKLWETDPNKKGDEPENFLGEINPQKIQEVAGQFNFLKNLAKEDIEAIKQGGEGAMQAMARAMNKASQNVFAQSAVASSKLIEQALAKQQESFIAKLPDIIKKQNFSNSLREENPAYAHPAAAPLVSMIEQQFASKFPNATTAELKSMAQEYFTTTLGAISGADKKKAEEAAKVSNSGIDWEKELGIFQS